MKIAVLARGLERPGGVGRLVRGYLASLPAASPGDEFLAVTDGPLPDGLAAPNLREIRLRKASPAVFDHFLVPRAMREARPDVFLATKNTLPARLRCPSACVFLDLAYFAMRESYPALDNVYMRAMFRRSARRAARIIAISESTRRDVKRFLGDEAFDKTRVAYPGLDARFRVMTGDELRAAREAPPRLPERFVLYPGNISPRKNLARLLDAFAGVDRETGLVMTGHRSWKSGDFAARVEAARRTHDVRVIGPQSDEGLAALYNLAEACVYPSLYEGFGFPVLEAFGCGTPVAASNASSIPEIAGDAAALFDPLDVADIARALREVTADAAARERPRQAGLARAREFTWEKTAAAVMAAIREIA